MLRNKSPGSSLTSGSTAASIKSEYNSVGYITLLIVRKLNSFVKTVLVQYTYLLIHFFYSFLQHNILSL